MPTVIDVCRVHSDGRITIPREIRRELELSDGDKVVWLKEAGRFYIERPVEGRPQIK
jgi:AbrB family looped-hinge helix DNA binding protein